MLRSFVVIALIVSMVFVFGCGGSKEIKYVKVKETIKPGKTENLTQDELKVESVLKQTAELPISAKYFKSFFSVAYLIIVGYDNLAFTVTIKDDKINLARGVDPNGSPDLIIPMNKQNCENLYTMLKDGEVSDEDEYKIFYVTFIPSYKSILKRDEIRC